jgi:hypothetical protein
MSFLSSQVVSPRVFPVHHPGNATAVDPAG